MYVFLNSPGYSYDVHSLVKAFYPHEDVKIVPDMPEGGQYISVYVSSGDIGKDERTSGVIRVTARLCNEPVSEEEKYENLSRSDVKNVLKRTLYNVLAAVTGHTLPWGTMTVNVVGCFLIGLLSGLSFGGQISPTTKLVLVTGFCGGFTTFSTFSKKALTLLQNGNITAFCLYATGSVVLGVSCVALGYWLAK